MVYRGMGRFGSSGNWGVWCSNPLRPKRLRIDWKILKKTAELRVMDSSCTDPVRTNFRASAAYRGKVTEYRLPPSSLVVVGTVYSAGEPIGGIRGPGGPGIAWSTTRPAPSSVNGNTSSVPQVKERQRPKKALEGAGKPRE